MLDMFSLETSTITCLARTNAIFNLNKLYQCLSQIVIPPNTRSMFIQYTEYNGKSRGVKTKRKTKAAVKTEKKKNPFEPHQVSVSINLDREIKMMIFKSVIKICGCTAVNDAISSVSFLMNYYITEDCYNLQIPNDELTFIFEEIMINKSFNLPYTIIKKNFNDVINLVASTSLITCFLQITEHSYVSMTTSAGEIDKCYLQLRNSPRGFILSQIRSKKNEKKGTTFAIFESNVIMSGSNILRMEQDYEFLRSIIKKYKFEIMA